MALSKSVVEGDIDSVPQFTTSELRDIFRLREDTVSDTHDLLNCKCTLSVQSQKKIPTHKKQGLAVDDLLYWDHIPNIDVNTKYPWLQKIGRETITFIFAKETEKKETAVGKNEVVVEEKESEEEEEVAVTSTTTTTSKEEESEEEEEQVKGKRKSVSKKAKTTTKRTRKVEVVAVDDSDDDADGGPDLPSEDENYDDEVGVNYEDNVVDDDDDDDDE